MGRTVSQVAHVVGLPARTVRYYARVGLVAPSRHTATGYGLYEPEDEGRLRFVRQAKAFGFSLSDIRQLLAAAENGCCEQVVPELQQLLQDKIAALDASITELQAFRQRADPLRRRHRQRLRMQRARCVLRLPQRRPTPTRPLPTPRNITMCDCCSPATAATETAPVHASEDDTGCGCVDSCGCGQTPTGTAEHQGSGPACSCS
jgi:DNA-binding transcriptional MerR regulator